MTLIGWIVKVTKKYNFKVVHGQSFFLKDFPDAKEKAEQHKKTMNSLYSDEICNGIYIISITEIIG